MENIEKLHAAISEKIGMIDFGALWPGFHHYEFALYTKDKVYLKDRQIPWDDRFFGNTTIRFEGKQIAIWNMEDAAGEEEQTKADILDIDILTADMVHEMFHAFQMEQGENRFPDDVKGLNYPMTAENFRIKHLENRILTEAFSTDSIEKKKELLLQFQLLRDMRERIAGERIRYEYLIETVEGMAEYAGTKALRQLSTEKYEKRMKKYLHILRVPSENLFDIRSFSYYTGTILLLAAENAGISLVHDIAVENKTVYELVKREQASEKDIIQNLLECRTEKQEKIILDFMEKQMKEVSGEFEICGYDPMNMFKFGNLIYGSNFFMLYDLEKESPGSIDAASGAVDRREWKNKKILYIDGAFQVQSCNFCRVALG